MMQRLRSRAILGLVATAGLAAVATGFSSPASAGTNCPSGNHCVFWSDFSSASHEFFNSDPNFNNDYFDDRQGSGEDELVNDNFESASNSSSTNTESHYWLNAQGSSTNRRLFCVNPGENATQSEVGAVNAWNLGSSLTLPGRTSVHCI